jgi:hypothetical protein
MVINTVNMTPSLGDIFKETSFAAANNQNVAANVTGLAFANATVRGFIAWITVTITSSSPGQQAFTFFELKGVQNATGWRLNSSYVGDNSGVAFSITSAGQIQYTSPNTGNFTGSTFKYRAVTTTV